MSTFFKNIKCELCFQFHQEECAKALLTIEEQSFSIGLNDIEFNFLISSVGIFEGRGWDVQPESPHNNDSLVIGFFTDYLYKPGEMLNETLKKLTGDGKFLGKLTEDFELLCITDLCSVPQEIVVTRSEWNAEPRKDYMNALSHPISTIVVTDTTSYGLESCDTKV